MLPLKGQNADEQCRAGAIPITHQATQARHRALSRAALALTLTVLGTLTPVLIKIAHKHDKVPYAPELVVCCAEACKALLCAASMIYLLHLSTKRASNQKDERRCAKDAAIVAAKIFALAVLYAVHNNMLIKTVRVVDIATFEVLYTWRVPATALALRLVMRKQFTLQQVVALALLMLGTTLTQWNGHRTQFTASPNGILMVILLVGTSSIACVWNEAMLKNQGMGTLPAQNMQLYGFGCLINASIAWFHGELNAWNSISMWSSWVWATVAIMSLLGLVTSATLKYADNIVRAFAAGGSILLTTILAWSAFGEPLTAFFLAGSILTCSATGLYFL